MPTVDAAQRVRERLRDWVKAEGRGSMKRLSDAVNALYGVEKSQSWATGIIRGTQDLRLKDLDAVARLLGVPPGELVRSYDRQYLEVTMAEAKLIEYFRLVPDTIRAHWLHFMEYLFRPHLAALAEQGRKREQQAKTPKKKETARAPRRAGNFRADGAEQQASSGSG